MTMSISMSSDIAIRPGRESDQDEIWDIMEPVIRAGDTYALPRGWSREAALSYWFAAPHQTFVAEDDRGLAGIAFLQPNQMGGGAHVANAAFMTAARATGRGVARALCAHVLEQARAQGFTAMQFNFVVASNDRAIALWHSFGFEVLARLPGAFDHPGQGHIDALVMFKKL